MEKMDYPLISCLCVTRAKPALLQRSISCFLGQTYPNAELVVAYDADDTDSKKAIDSIKHPNVIFYELKRSKEITIDYMRTRALEKAKGDYVCLWADDDWHHIARIEYQFQALAIKGLPACVLHYLLIYDMEKKRVLISNKRIWEETLFCKKNILKKNVSDPDFILGEGTVFLEHLHTEKKIYLINDVPNLYLYTYYHEKDTWSDGWSEILDYSYELDSDDSKAIENFLERTENVLEDSLSIDRLIGNSLFEEEEDFGPGKIPKIIHLTYKSKTIPDKYLKTYDSIKTVHPDWEIVIYDDSDCLKIVQDHFPEILDIYNAYPCNIQRTDIFRILIVYLKGGFYLDLDMYCLKSLNELRRYNLVLGEEKTYTNTELKMLNFKHEIQVANYMFGSTPRNSFWIEVLLESIKRANYKITHMTDVLRSTGPWMLSHVYYDLKNKYDIKLLRNKFKRCHKGCPTVSCHFGDFASHGHIGGWLWHNKENDVPQPNNELNKVTELTIKQALDSMSKRSEH